MKYPLKKIIIDIKNYFFIRKIIKRNYNSVEWQKYKLRFDWIGRIYTVINLPPEVLHSPDTPQDIRYAYILEEMRPINEYLTKLNLHEIIIPKIKPIKNSISYLIIYKPYFQKLSWKWIISQLLLIIVLLWLNYKFDIFSYIMKLYEFIIIK